MCILELSIGGMEVGIGRGCDKGKTDGEGTAMDDGWAR